MPSLASSLGWKFISPSGIQRRAPLTPLPIAGTSTKASSTSAATKSQGATFSHNAIGNCTTTSAVTMPISSASAWRDRKCVVV